VTNPNRPGKLPIVFDAARTSQNKNLLQGPDMTNSLVGALLHFREGRVGLAADVEEMFHQVRVRKEDQEALRFLWWSDNYTHPPDVYVMEVHIFGATSSPCVANYDQLYNYITVNKKSKKSKKIASGVSAIKRIRDFVPREILLTVYNSLIQPHVDYCSVLWGCCSKGLSQKLQKLHDRAARIITFPNYDRNTDELLHSLYWHKT